MPDFAYRVSGTSITKAVEDADEPRTGTLAVRERAQSAGLLRRVGVQTRTLAVEA